MQPFGHIRGKEISFDLFGGLPELLREFFDYKGFGEWMMESGWFVKAADDIYVQIPDDDWLTACTGKMLREAREIR